VTITVVFSETMDTTVSPTVVVTGLISSPYTVTETSYVGDTWVGTFTLLDEDEVGIGSIDVSGAVDPAGNVMVAAPGAGTFEVNTTGLPTVVSATAVPDPAPAGLVTITVVFSETMDTTVSPTVVVTGLISSPYTVTETSYVGDTWVGTFTLLDDNEVATATIAVSLAQDVAGNVMVANPTAGTFAVDTVDPTVVSATAVPDPAPAGLVTITVVFSETMDTTVSPTVVVTGLASSPYTVTETSYVGDTWVGTFTLLDDNEVATATIAVSLAQDVAGNVMAPDATWTFEVDTVTEIPALYAFINDWFTTINDAIVDIEEKLDVGGTFYTFVDNWFATIEGYVQDINWADITDIKAKTDTINWLDITAIWDEVYAIELKLDVGGTFYTFVDDWFTIIKGTIDAIKAKTDTIVWSDITDIKTEVTNIEGKLDDPGHGLAVIKSAIDDIGVGDGLNSAAAPNVVIARNAAVVITPASPQAFWGQLTVESTRSGYNIEVWDGDSWLPVVPSGGTAQSVQLSGFGLRIFNDTYYTITVDYVFVYHLAP